MTIYSFLRFFKSYNLWVIIARSVSRDLSFQSVNSGVKRLQFPFNPLQLFLNFTDLQKKSKTLKFHWHLSFLKLYLERIKYKLKLVLWLKKFKNKKLLLFLEFKFSKWLTLEQRFSNFSWMSFISNSFSDSDFT